MDAVIAKDTGIRRKATMIFQGGMGNIIVSHIYLLDHGTRKFAQYKNAVFCNYVEKGKRKAKGFIQTYSPYLILLEGWQDIESQSLWKTSTTATKDAVIVEAHYGSCDERWVADFETSNKFKDIIADYRNFNTL